MPGTERRLSTSSEDANGPPQRQLSQDGTEIIPTRMSKVTTPKPASNPLQFIKTGPCDLYKAAQEQIKKVEEIKKVEKVKDDSEDWQSNLDNWKCSRRKRQEHIIERVVEVKKLELVEHDRNRRRSKTFNEMMEERNSKGGLRKMSILSFSEEDSNDLSDLGITKSKEKSGGDFAGEQVENGSGNRHASTNDQNGVKKTNGHSNSSAYEDGSSTPATISSPEPEEYTYERAIQNYMDFAEAKVKTSAKSDKEKGVNGNVNFRICAMKKEPGGKIGAKLSELEQIRLRSKSTNDISGGNDAKQLPKVDVLKRRSLFENADAADTVAVKSNDRVPKDLSNTKTIKERLSNLEKSSEKAAKVNSSSGEVVSNIKDTISSLEKQKTLNGTSSTKRLSNGDLSPQISIKERLNTLEKQNGDEGVVKSVISSEGVPPVSVKERMSSYDEATTKTFTSKVEPERDAGFKEKLETFKLTEKIQNEIVNSITGNSSNICSDSIQNLVKPAVETSEKKDTPVATQKPEESNHSQSLFEQTETKSTVASAEPVSSAQHKMTACGNSVLVGDKKMETSGSDVKPKATDSETDRMAESESMVGDGVGHTNQKLVEDDWSRVALTEPTDCIRTLSSENVSNSSRRKCSDVSKTIVTHISLPDAQVPGPRVNISVSFDSVTKDYLPSYPKDEDEDEYEALDEFPDSVSNLSQSRPPVISTNSPQTRVRKLTPMVSAPQISPTSPLKTICELQIIEEGEDAERFEEEHKSIAVHMNPGENHRSNNEVQEIICTKMADEKEAETKFNEDTKTGEDKGLPDDDGQDESTVMYTDENIEEVLGKDDEDEEEEEEEELETMVDEEPQYEPITEEAKIQKELEIFTPKDNVEILLPLKPVELMDKPLPVSANYENIFITNQVPQLSLSPDSDIYSTLSFPLGSRPTIEPPKEKPPPPPLDVSDDESTKPELPPKPSLRRLDSTKRIKKEIRKKRSDFLGIEGLNDDSYLEPEIYVAPPPDMMTFLQEERRLEQQLYRQSICSESDSNHETAESRDSGVELDRGHVDDICWSKPDVMSEPHSRQNSETFGNTSITSEEDEILKKEREIIEVLEKEEQWRYGNKNSHSAEQNDIGEKLAVKLRQLEQEKIQLERERAEEEDRRKAEESARRRNEQQLIVKQQQLRQQESSPPSSNTDSSISSTVEQEALRFERERLHKEQEHLERCRQNLMEQQQNPEQGDVYHRGGNVSHWDTPSNRHSLQEVPIGVPMVDVPRHSMQDVSQPQYSSQMSSGYRYSLPDLQQRESRSTRPPPPIPPAKPIRPMTQEQWERETNIRNSRIPSADNIPLQIEASTKLRHGSSVPAININHSGQQMTRSTLHALSAAPRSRIISNENWMQPKRKTDVPKSNYNYQHWLIQEAEHRRILEHQHKVSQQLQSKRTLPYNGQMSSAAYGGSPPSHHTVGLPISPPVQSGQPNQKWISPPRTDKPLPDSIIQTLTQRVQNRENKTPSRRRTDNSGAQLPNKLSPSIPEAHTPINSSGQSQERMLSVSGKKKCSHCNEELGRGAAMIIESLRLFYHIDCFKCCVCHVQLGDGLMGTDVRVRNNKLHCHNCYSSDDGKILATKVKIKEEESDVKIEQGNYCNMWSQTDAENNSFHNPNNKSMKIDFFPDAFNNNSIPEWFKEFYAHYLHNESKKYEILERVFLQMIDFEIEKCEILRDIISKLKH